MAITKELLDISFNSWIDNTLRHTIYVKNVVLSENIIASNKSAYFINKSYLQILDNQDDWILGSTVNNSLMSSKNWGPTNSDNDFTFDCWIYPISNEFQYSPIISCFKDIWFNNLTLNLGWTLQLDTFSGKLQLISYLFGDSYNRIIESYGTVRLNRWNHVALMSWKTESYSSKYFFINGVADGGYLYNRVEGYKEFPSPTKFFPISNIISHKAYNGIDGIPDYSPFYIGLGPRSSFTNPNLDSSFYFKKDSGLSFWGNIGHIRMCLGNRYSISGSSFDPFFNISTTTITTTTTTTSTLSTMSTQGERGEILLVPNKHDLLALKLRNDLVDLTNRHYIWSIGNPIFSLTDLGCNSILFDGTNYLLVTLNAQDFSLGSTLVYNDYDNTKSLCKNDNQFSLEFWIYPQNNGERYMGICGSFSKNFAPVDFRDYNVFKNITKRRDYNLGWSILLDCEQEKLKIINFNFNNIKNVITSNLLVPFNQWTHIALMSTTIGNATGIKFLFINGNPDIISPYNSNNSSLTNGLLRASLGSNIDSYAPLYIGMAANAYIEDKSKMLDYNFGNKFTGYMSTFRLSSSTNYPTDGTGFVPYYIPDSITVTSGTTQTSTSISTESTTITGKFPGYIKITGILSSNNDVNSSNWSQIICQ